MKKTKLRIDRIVKVLIAFILIITVIAIAIRGTYNSIIKFDHPIEYSEYVEKYAQEYNLEEALLYAIIKNESGFNPQAKSSADARGLTQILPSTFTWLQTKTGEDLEVEALFEPEISIRYGALLLNILSDYFSETETIIAAYHAGVGQVGEWLKDSEYSDDGKTLIHIPFDDTRLYVERVTKSIKIYEERLGDED